MSVRFDMIRIFVSDLETMAAFYENVVGLQRSWTGEGSYAEFSHDGIRFSMFERSKLRDPDGNLIEIASDFWG